MPFRLCQQLSSTNLPSPPPTDNASISENVTDPSRDENSHILEAPSPSPPEVSLNLLNMNYREQRLVHILRRHAFTDKQASKIIQVLREDYDPYEIDPSIVDEAMKFWWENIKPPFKETVPGATVPMRDVIARDDNAKLLLINPVVMEKRIEALRSLAFISGGSDIYRIFVFAPTAFFLQDWSHFCQKFFYLQHRVCDWIIDKKKDPFPVPHPIVAAPKCMSLPYHVLKARFEFAIRTGIKSPKFIRQKNLKQVEITFKTLFLSDIDEYLRVIAPGVTDEEYFVFENYIQQTRDSEDEIIAEICALNELGGQAKEVVDPRKNSKAFDRLKKRQKIKMEKEALKRGRKFDSSYPPSDDEEDEEDEDDSENIVKRKPRDQLKQETMAELMRLTHLSGHD